MDTEKVEILWYYQVDRQKKKKRRGRYKIITFYEKRLMLIINGFTEEEAKARAREVVNTEKRKVILIDVTFFPKGCEICVYKPVFKLEPVKGVFYGQRREKRQI